MTDQKNQTGNKIKPVSPNPERNLPEPDLRQVLYNVYRSHERFMTSVSVVYHLLFLIKESLPPTSLLDNKPFLTAYSFISELVENDMPYLGMYISDMLTSSNLERYVHCGVLGYKFDR